MSRITFYGHSSFHVSHEGGQFLVDPFISPNPKASSIDVDQLQADQIFLSHAHQDHMADVERIAAHNPDVVVISNFEIANYFGAKEIQTVGMNHGGIWSGGTWDAKYVSAIHSSSFPDGSYGGNPGGWVFKLSDGKTIYMAGDTCLTQDMKLIPMMFGPIDLAVLPIGGLFTMHADEAALAAQFVETKVVIGCHYDTFPPIEIDHQSAKATFKSKGVSLHLLEIGAAFEL